MDEMLMIEPAAGLDHARDGKLAGHDDSLHVHGHDVVPVLFGHFDHGSPAGDAHVVVQDVQPSVAFDAGIHHALAVGGPGNVGLDRGGHAALGLDHLHGLRSPLFR